MFWVRYLLFLIWKLRKQVRINDNYQENRQRRPEPESKLIWIDWIASGPTGTNRIRPKVSICSILFWTRGSFSGSFSDGRVCLRPQLSLFYSIYQIKWRLIERYFHSLWNIWRLWVPDSFIKFRKFFAITEFYMQTTENNFTLKGEKREFNATDETKPI